MNSGPKAKHNIINESMLAFTDKRIIFGIILYVFLSFLFYDFAGKNIMYPEIGI